MQANKRDQKSNAKTAAATAKAIKQVEEVKHTAESQINKIAEEDAPVSNASFSSSENSQVDQIPAGKMHPVPKRPITPFFLFTIDNQNKLRESRPDGGKQKNITELAIELGNRWQLLGDKDKSKYQTLFEQDRTRYKNQLEEVKTNGFFVMDDGQKSNHVLVNIPKKDRDNVKKVSTRTRGTQTGKEWFQYNLAENVKAKTDKIEMKIEAEVKKRVKTLLKKRSHTPVDRHAKKVMKVEASTSPDKSVKSDKKLTSKTSVKSQSTSKNKPNKATEFGNTSRSRSKTPQKGQASVKVKTEQSSASKQKSSGSVNKMAQKDTQSQIVRSKQTKKRSQALAQAQ